LIFVVVLYSGFLLFGAGTALGVLGYLWESGRLGNAVHHGYAARVVIPGVDKWDHVAVMVAVIYMLRAVVVLLLCHLLEIVLSVA
jgi:hypothetical protein